LRIHNVFFPDIRRKDQKWFCNFIDNSLWEMRKRLKEREGEGYTLINDAHHVMRSYLDDKVLVLSQVEGLKVKARTG